MARRTKAHEWSDHPEYLTSIRSPWEHFQKADWNFSRYENAVFARPCDSEAVMYSAIDFAIAIVSLRDWTRRWLFKDMRKLQQPLPSEVSTSADFLDWVRARVPWQGAIEAIANTAKHGEYKDGDWPDGIAFPTTFVPETLRAEHEACVGGHELFAFMHRHRDVAWWDVAFMLHPSEHAEPGYVIFGDALDQWKAILAELKLTED